MTSRSLSSVTISLDDLTLVSEAVMLRHPHRAAEQRRIARIRELLGAATQLSRALTLHTQHALVNCQGSHGIADPVSDAAALHEVLAAYAVVLREVASECRPIVRAPSRAVHREPDATVATSEASAA
jgi:hypothetical protein